MPEKLTYEFVKESFESGGYTLLSDDYINSSTKLDYRCSKGHEHSIVWSHWQQGHRCPTCAGVIKPIIEYIRLSFKREGYILLSKAYINAHTKLDYRCSNEHEHSISWTNWCGGYKCPICAGKMKLTLDQVRKSFEDSNYILLSKEYINARTKLNYRCSKGHEHSIKWGDWYQGIRCPSCYGKNIKYTLEQIREFFSSEEYELLSNRYKDVHTKLDYRCPKGHEHSIRLSGWLQGYRCPICYNIKISGPGNHGWKGGISYEPYCPIWSDKEYKKDIKLRDGNKCLNPDCWKKDSRIHIHHIDYNKKSCSPSNVITLCGSCNTRANTNREWHTAWYQALMYMRYKYKY